MTIPIRMFAAIALLGMALAGLDAAPAMAAGSSTGTSNTETQADSQDLKRGKQAIESGAWERAARHLERAAASDPRNADVFNLLAYSYRHLGRLDDAFTYYGRALALDPGHRGAHEYIGEAYLLVGDPAMAEEHLSILKEVCGDCEEADELAEAIDRFRAGEAQ